MPFKVEELPRVELTEEEQVERVKKMHESFLALAQRGLVSLPTPAALTPRFIPPVHGDGQKVLRRAEEEGYIAGLREGIEIAIALLERRLTQDEAEQAISLLRARLDTTGQSS